MDLLTIIVPVIPKDVLRLRILFQSLTHFMDPQGTHEMIIITPKTHQEHIMSEIQSFPNIRLPIRYLTDEEIAGELPSNASGWFRQQVIKLMVSQYIQTSFYLIFDCDVFAMRKWSASNLVRKGRAIIELQDINGKDSEFRDIEQTCKLLEMSPQKIGNKVITVTPAVLSTEICRDLLRFLQIKFNQGSSNLKKFGYELCKKMVQTCNGFIMTEYILYFVYAVKTGMLRQKHFLGRLSNNSVWYLNQVMEWKPKPGDKYYFSLYQSHLNIPPEIIYDQIRDIIGDPLDYEVSECYGIKRLPLISCLMVTKDRLGYVKSAIQSFQNQTYPNKELIIVCDSKDGVEEYVKLLGDKRIKMHQLSKSNMILGELRNYSVRVAQGEYVCQWDDDDWSHPSRLSLQYQRILQTNSDICLLGQWTMIWPKAKRYMISRFRKEGWEGTMLVRKDLLPKYVHIDKAEDTILMQNLQRYARIHVIEDPMYWLLYVYVVHGANTWDSGHFSRMFSNGFGFEKIWQGKDFAKFSETLCSITNQPYWGYEGHSNESNLEQIWLIIVIILLVILSLLLLRR